MPFSASVFDRRVADILQEIKPNVVFDVGVGAGKIGAICREVLPLSTTCGFEVYAPNFEAFQENYTNDDRVTCVDFRAWIKETSDWNADMIVFGDVLEHFFWSEVCDTIQFCLYRVKYLLAIWPTGLRQNSYQNNLEESHRSNFDLSDLARYPVRFYQRLSYPDFDYHLILLEGW